MRYSQKFGLVATLWLMMIVGVMARTTDLLPTPKVVEIKSRGEFFALGRPVAVDDRTRCELLKDFFRGHRCPIVGKARARVVVEMVDSIPEAYDYHLTGFECEAYQLDVSANTIRIRAVKPIGVIRATQTLAQLAEGYADLGVKPRVEAVSITDWPAFKLRGWMQDVGRSFLPIDELKNEVSLLSRFKVNVFHWHLTENLAWRFEVKAFPALTMPRHMVRYPGMAYTQRQCQELEAYAKAHGIIVIPEIDMPGHSDAFRSAMGFDMQSPEGRQVLKTILREVAETFREAPYIHIGGDEVMVADGFLEEMAGFVRDSLGRRVVVWNKLRNKAVTPAVADMTQMWATSGTAVKGLPNIDCRYNYANHFDTYADLVGIYKSNIYYVQRGNADIAGTISATWNDTKLPTANDILIQNNQYANILASTERAWKGGGLRYIEQGGTTLPNSGEEYEEFVDFERRLLFHKAHSLRGVSMAYVKQTNVSWRITDPLPNEGDATKVFPLETCGDALLPSSFEYNGRTCHSQIATGAGIYLRHIWHPTVPSYYPNPGNGQTAYAWTYVYSPVAQEVGAQIEFYTYSRSGNERAPLAGQWDRRSSRVWLNDSEIEPPTWMRPDSIIPQDHATLGLTNENLTARPVVPLRLNKGWNKVFIKLPHASNGGTGRDKWQFTFVLTDPTGTNALDNIVYSPDKKL